MTTYLKDDFEFDFGIFVSKISMVSSKVYSTIEKFSDCLEKIEEESSVDVEIAEDLGTVEIPKDLVKSLMDLSENLKNQIYLNSIAVSIFSFLEFSLIEYCRIIDGYIVYKKPFKDYSNLGLDKAKEYLKDNLNIDFGTVSNWNEIKKFQRVRNLIVHNNANIITDNEVSIEDQTDYKVLSAMNKSIEITSSGTIFIKTFDYINDIQEKVIELVNDIIDKTKKNVKKKDKPSNHSK